MKCAKLCYVIATQRMSVFHKLLYYQPSLGMEILSDESAESGFSTY